MLEGAFEILALIVSSLGYEGDAERLIRLSILVFCRFATLSFAVSAFGFGKRAIAGRLGFALALTTLGVPGLSGELVVPGGGLFILLLLKETAIGFGLGFVLSLVFDAARSAGNFIQLQTGLGSSVSDEKRFDSLPDFKILVASLLFFVSGAYIPVVGALMGSLNSVPVSALNEVPAQAEWMPLFVSLVVLYFSIILAIALPIVFVLMIAEILVGVIQRLVPEIAFHGLAVSVKALLLMTTTAIILGVIVSRIGSSFSDITNAIQRVAGLFV